MLRHSGKLLIIALAAALSAAPAAADTVSGRVVDPLGVGVAGVVLDFGGGVVPVNDTTGPAGNFAVTVPAGTYNIELNPPAGSNLVAIRLVGVVVVGTVNLGTLTMQDGFPLSGRIVDAGGAAIAGGDVDVFDQATGVKLFTPNDASDATGAFSVLLPAGTFRVRLEPPAGQLVVAQELMNVVVAGPTAVGTVVLPPGVALTGIVRDGQTLARLANVDVDATDTSTGVRIVTPNDDTDAQGVFTIVVPTGTYRVTLDPAPGDPHAGREIVPVAVNGPTNMGFIDLDRGFFVNGTVRRPGGAPLPKVDIDVQDLAGDVPLYVSNGRTDASGQFSLVVTAGTYRFTVVPDLALGLAAAETAATTVGTNVTLPVFNLQAGFVLTGTVTPGFGGAPERGCRVEVVHSTTGVRVPTPLTITDSSGVYTAIVPPGTYDLAFRTRKATLARDDVSPAVSINGPTTLNKSLPLVPLFVFLDDPPFPDPQIVAPGGFVFINLVFYNPTFSFQAAHLRVSIIDPFGGEILLAPPFLYALPSMGSLVAPFQPIPMPPVNPAHIGLPFRFRIVFTDPVTGDELDRDEFLFIVQ